MDVRFAPIVLRYDGLDASQGAIELTQFGSSVQGAARMLGSAGHLVLTGQYAKRSTALSVRVLGGIPKPGSYELPALLMLASPLLTPMLPILADSMKQAATKAVTSVVGYTLAKLSGRPNEAQMALQIADRSLTEMGQTSRAAFAAIERLVDALRPSARQFVTPIGESCSTAMIGEAANGALAVDKPTRDAIETPDPVEIGAPLALDVLISELDLRNKSCKCNVRNETVGSEPDQRINAVIVDPVLGVPNNVYSAALAGNRWLRVTAKPQIVDGEIERLYIMDAATSAPAALTGPG